MVMAKSPEVIIIDSSGDETDHDDVICLGAHACSVKMEPNNLENVAIFINDSPDVKRDRPSFKINKAKLDLLRKRVGNSSIKSSHSLTSKVGRLGGELKINKKRLRKLKAHIKVELMKYVPKSPCLKMNGKLEISQDSKVLANTTRNLFGSSNCKQSPIKHFVPSNLQVKNSQTIPTAAGHQVPSSGCITPTKDPHFLTQSSIKTWLTPIKKFPRTTPAINADVKHVTTKRNEVVWPPIHVTLDSTKFISRLYKPSRMFPACYMDIIEGLKDELFLFQVVRTIQNLMSSYAPSSDLISFLIQDVLLNSNKRGLSFATYLLLSEIHARFPACCIAIHIEWGSIKCLTERLTSLFTSGTKLQFLNASLALLFIISILSSEVKFTALKTRTTRLARHFSSDFDHRNMREIIAGIKVCLNNHRETCGYRKSDTGNHLDLTNAEKSLSANYGFCSLELFQNLLKFDIVLSCCKEKVARTIADELMSLYMDLPSLEARILLLQTLKSHLIRRYLIEVLLMNYCQLSNEALQGNEMHMGARKILMQDFLRCPPRRSSEYSSVEYTAEEVEEYVTLVAYLLQSYMAMHSSSLQCIHSDFPIFQVNQVSQLTSEDIVFFRDLKWHVSKLRKRCLHFIGESPQKLSIRTEIMLEMLAIWTDEF